MSEPKKLDDLSEKDKKGVLKEAFSKMASAVGTTPEKLDEIAKKKKEGDELVEFVIPVPVKINGKVYPAKLKLVEKARIVEGIVSMAGNKTMRLIREKVGHEYEVYQLAGGQISSRLIKSEDGDGIKVSKI